MSRVELEMRIVTATRLSRALFLAIKGIAADKEFEPTQEDLDALDELSWKAHQAAKAAEAEFFAPEIDKVDTSGEGASPERVA